MFYDIWSFQIDCKLENKGSLTKTAHESVNLRFCSNEQKHLVYEVLPMDVTIEDVYTVNQIVYDLENYVSSTRDGARPIYMQADKFPNQQAMTRALHYFPVLLKGFLYPQHRKG